MEKITIGNKEVELENKDWALIIAIKELTLAIRTELSR